MAAAAAEQFPETFEIPGGSSAAAGCSERSSFRRALAELLQVQLDRSNVSDERLEEWLLAETREEAAKTAAVEQATIPALRGELGHMLMEMTQWTVAPRDCWFQALRLLDACGRGEADGPEAKATPQSLLRAGAIWLVCLKSEDSDREIVYRAVGNCVHTLISFAARLEVDLGGVAATKAALLAEERKLLSELSLPGAPVLGSPTVLTWYDFVATRFDIATHGVAHDSLSAATTWAHELAVSAAYSAPASAASPPRMWAVGIFGLTLVATGLLPEDALCPPDVDRGWWTRALAWLVAAANRARTRAGVQPQAKSLDPNVVSAAFEFAAGTSASLSPRGAFAALSLVYEDGTSAGA